MVLCLDALVLGIVVLLWLGLRDARCISGWLTLLGEFWLVCVLGGAGLCGLVCLCCW